MCFLLLDAASKHAAVGFFDCLRAEMEEFDISVSTVSPTFICSYHRQPAPGNWEASIWKCKSGWMKVRHIKQEGGFSRVKKKKKGKIMEMTERRNRHEEQKKRDIGEVLLLLAR